MPASEMAICVQSLNFLSIIIAFSLRCSKGITLFARNAEECSQDMMKNQQMPMRDFHRCSLNDTCTSVVWNEEKKTTQMSLKLNTSTDCKGSINTWTKTFLPEEPIILTRNGTQLTGMFVGFSKYYGNDNLVQLCAYASMICFYTNT